jgi:hypothetical protein
VSNSACGESPEVSTTIGNVIFTYVKLVKMELGMVPTTESPHKPSVLRGTGGEYKEL